MKNELLKVTMNPKMCPAACLAKMEQTDSEYVTWVHGARFIARKSYISKLAHNKSCLIRADRLEVFSNETVRLGEGLTVDEVLFELDANNADKITYAEGLDRAETTVTRASVNVISEVLYNKEFDCSAFWA